MPTGAVIQLDFAAGGLIEAEIRWSKGTQFGVQFKEKFNLKLLQPTKPIAKPTIVLTPNYLSAATEHLAGRVTRAARSAALFAPHCVA